MTFPLTICRQSDDRLVVCSPRVGATTNVAKEECTWRNRNPIKVILDVGRSNKQDGFSNDSAQSVTDTNWTHTRIFVESNQSARQERGNIETTGSTWEEHNLRATEAIAVHRSLEEFL